MTPNLSNIQDPIYYYHKSTMVIDNVTNILLCKNPSFISWLINSKNNDIRSLILNNIMLRTLIGGESTREVELVSLTIYVFLNIFKNSFIMHSILTSLIHPIFFYTG